MSDLSNIQNDALWAVKMGKAPNEQQQSAILSAAAKIGSDNQMAASALVRMLGGYGADAPLVDLLKSLCEKKDVSADLVEMLDQYADPDAESPDSFDISQMSNILNLLLEVDDLVDPATRPEEEDDTQGDSDGGDEEKTCLGLQNFLDSAPWQIFTALITAWALFATDIALAWLPKSSDWGIAVVTFLAFIGFAFEWISNMVSGRDYGSDLGNLFWWLDAIGTLSLIPDFLILFMDEELEVNDNVTLARVARAARIGARLSRLTKVFRVKDGQSSFSSMLAEKGIELDEDDDGEDVASQVGAKVADGISKKVVILVITLLVFIPIFTYNEPAGGIRQTKEEAVAMLKSIKDSTSPGLGKCQEGLPARSDDPKIDGAPYVGYPFIDKNRAQKIDADWSPCCGLQPGSNTPAELTNTNEDKYHPDNLINNDKCIATCTAAGTGPLDQRGQKAVELCDPDAGDILFAGMPEAERLSLIEFLQLQGDRVIMFTWDRGIAKGEYQVKTECDADPTCTDFKTNKSPTFGEGSSDCKSYSCARDEFLPPKPKIGEETPPAGLPNHGPGLFFKMSRRFYELREVEIRRYGDTVEECTVDNNCMTEEESMKKPESTYSFEGLEFWVDLSEQTKHEAGVQILYMWFIIVIFAIASLVFMGSLQTMVIEPVEGMTKAMTMVTKSLIDLGGSGSGTDGEAAYIESSILKIVGLLNVSFGDAGTKIIQRNMQTGSSELNSAVPGEKVTAVYGFSDIREFTATTEALSQDIVLFVNEFANICHGQCISTGGAPNKNVGDAFLCVWKDKDSTVQCDKALEAYRQSVQKIRSSAKLTKLIARPDIAKTFPPAEREFGTYLPSMGFGLHHGSSVEGAIGTSLKMDAAYLGADVDLADVLEMNTKEYKTPILMTEAFYNQLSERVQKTCRKVDRVLASASPEPFYLYAANVASVDGSYFDRGIEEDVFVTDEQGIEDGSADASGDDGRWDGMVDPWNDEFEAAVDAYVAGDWAAASKSLSSCLDERPWDGPALKLQDFIQSRGGSAPSGWAGYQEL